MTVSRQLFDFTDTGTQVVTGPNFSGRVEQWRWVGAAGDTGGLLEIGIYPRAGDTGDGWLIVSRATEQQMRASFSSDDTGVVVYGAGDRLQVKKTSAVPTGRLYVWIKS